MFRKYMAGQGIYVFAYDKTTGVGQTGDSANITALISKDGGTTASLTDTNPTEIGGGWYWFDVSQDESNADALVIIPTSVTTNVLVKDVHIETEKGVFSDGAGTGAGSLGATTGLVQNSSLVSSETQAQDVWEYVISAITTTGSAAAIVNAIKTLTDKLETALEADGATGYQYTTLALENAPTGSGSSDVTSINGVSVTGPDDLKADVSALASQASVDTIDGIVDAILEDTSTTIPASITALPAAVWAVVLSGTKTASTALLDLWCRLVGDTTNSVQPTDTTEGSQTYLDPDGAEYDSITVDTSGNRTTD